MVETAFLRPSNELLLVDRARGYVRHGEADNLDLHCLEILTNLPIAWNSWDGSQIRRKVDEKCSPHRWKHQRNDIRDHFVGNTETACRYRAVLLPILGTNFGLVGPGLDDQLKNHEE
jgi:hypothetical protein